MKTATLNSTMSLEKPGTTERHFGYVFTVQEFDGDEDELAPGELPWKHLAGDVPDDMIENEVKAGRMTIVKKSPKGKK